MNNEQFIELNENFEQPIQNIPPNLQLVKCSNTYPYPNDFTNVEFYM